MRTFQVPGISNSGPEHWKTFWKNSTDFKNPTKILGESGLFHLGGKFGPTNRKQRRIGEFHPYRK
ncbi:hypothetical protein JWG45_17635 [Leptospira sp. 201903070]|uniref:Uncharacterized protein n=1 Tax=Leptospira ainlahdjerensis TaxID=2810033 RepID=A0ABS2UF10_9LEPT|nr:hypothetical protein [Leptospira ainlahdjerensis]MBM9578971.1 hypothetical protein [Leptospira ainlahdjerensis]